MLPIELLVVDSNSAQFPAGSRIGGYSNNGVLVELAGYEIEGITSSATSVHVSTALGYHFTFNLVDYQQATST
jgi:hypothetical protein